jgi:hypothetical protein
MADRAWVSAVPLDVARWLVAPADAVDGTGLDALRRHAAAAGCYVAEVWCASGRSFAAVVVRPSRTTRTA